MHTRQRKKSVVQRLRSRKNALAVLLTVSMGYNLYSVTQNESFKSFTQGDLRPITSNALASIGGFFERASSLFDDSDRADIDIANNQVLSVTESTEDSALAAEVRKEQAALETKVLPAIDEIAEEKQATEIKEKIITQIENTKDEIIVPTAPTGPIDGYVSSAKTLQAPKIALTKSDILSDKDARINKALHVTPTLKQRVEFWFDIYTKYGFADRVIHHSDFPWIVFEVVDIRPQINANKGPKWLRVTRGEKVASLKFKQIRATLYKLASMKNFNRLNELEQKLFDSLKSVPGSRKSVFTKAAVQARTQTGQKDFYQSGLIAGSEYFPKMEEIFKAKGLPAELTRLPLVESSFNVYATSKVGASGIWQFMPGIGKRFMKVDSIIDERRSPLKATEIAAKLLKENYTILWREWPLAMTAYNHGPGGVRKASIATGTRDLGTIANKYRSKSFSFASSNFYSCFLAALHAEKYKEYLFAGTTIRTPLQFKEIKLSSSTRASTLLKRFGLNKKEMFTFNPDMKIALDRNASLPAGFRIILPQELLLAKAQGSKKL